MTTYKQKLTCLALLTAFNGTVQAHESVSCDSTTTLISSIQGSTKTSPMVGEKVTVQALVSAVKPGMGGYYLQQKAADWVNPHNTSQGIFVADKSHSPKVGDLLVVGAKVAEERDFTQLEKVDAYTVCSQGHEVKTTTVKLPLSSKNQLEALEGMLIALPQTLTISENYGYTRYGQLLLSNGRLFQATNIAKPGAEADKINAANRLNQIKIDDSSMAKNPPMTLDVDHHFRVGNSVSGVKGVLHYSFGSYMIEPTAPIKYTVTNHREAKPMIKHQGDLRVASFNVLNYFNGNGAQKTFPTKRGAHSKAEFDRQTTKIVAAMKTINADVFGLMEIENDGYGPDSAIAELTNSLNKASGFQYRYVKPKSDRLGSDVIAVGMIYKTNKVQLVGKAATLSETPFNSKSRQPLAQTFKDKASGESFTLVVNHFKSKGSCPKDRSDPNANQNDGQACWNALRTVSATKLLSWLASHPTGSKDPDVLIIGDLNANAKEQPITTLIESGYTNMIEKYQGKAAYSFVYRGLSGYLDHALASKSLVAQVVDTVDWHINADEMRITDYNLENKSPEQQRSLFKADAFRSSDHDPVIIELKLK